MTTFKIYDYSTGTGSGQDSSTFFAPLDSKKKEGTFTSLPSIFIHLINAGYELYCSPVFQRILNELLNNRLSGGGLERSPSQLMNTFQIRRRYRYRTDSEEEEVFIE